MSDRGKIRFIIFGQGRTGSKLLAQLLNSHPDIRCDGEILQGYSWGKISRRFFLPFWRYYPIPLLTYTAAKSRQRAYGFRLFVTHCVYPERIVPRLVRYGWQIIHLWRRDLLTQAISAQAARQTKLWHRWTDTMKNTPISITLQPDDLFSALAATEANHGRCVRILQGLPHLDVVYEDDLMDPEKWHLTSARLLDFLGLPHKPLFAKLVKTWEQPYSQLIANYTEIEQALRSRNLPTELN